MFHWKQCPWSWSWKTLNSNVIGLKQSSVQQHTVVLNFSEMYSTKFFNDAQNGLWFLGNRSCLESFVHNFGTLGFIEIESKPIPRNVTEYSHSLSHRSGLCPKSENVQIQTHYKTTYLYNFSEWVSPTEDYPQSMSDFGKHILNEKNLNH